MDKFRQYLNEHGISEETINKFVLKTDLHYIYGEQIVIPIFDKEGKFLFNRYRNLASAKGNNIPKFISDPGSKTQLYNLQAIKDSEYAFIFEGEPDVWKAVEDGIPATTLTSGAATINQELVRDLIGKKVVVCYDTDSAGRKGAEKVLEVLTNSILIELPKDIKDYCEYRKNYSLNDFRKLVNEAIQRNGLKAAEPFIDNFENSKPKQNKPSWPSPLVEAAFFGLAGEVVKTIEPYSEADPVAILANFLTGIGSIIGDEPHFTVEADYHPTRLFCNLVGDTSKGRKGTSWGYLKQIFGQLDIEWSKHIQSGLSSGEGLIWAVRDQIIQKQPIKEHGRVIDYQEVITDPGVTDKRLLVVESEFASTLRVLGRDGNTLSPIIRNAWDSGNLQTLTKNSPAKATRAHISIIGHITRQELLRYLTSTEAANGFGNRFLWFCVKRSKVLPFGSKFSELDLTPLIDKLILVMEFATSVQEVTWAEETKPIWAEIYPKLSEGKPGLIGSIMGRAEAYVIRIACIYTLLDLSKTIKPEHLRAALAIWKYVEDSVRYIFQDKTGDPLTDDISNFLFEHPVGSSRTEISEHFGKHKSSEQISESLILLEGLGLAKKEIIYGDGRPTELWLPERSGEKGE